MSITDDGLPRPRPKAGDPHRQRAAGVEQAVVHALAVPVELLARALGQAAELAVQIAIQAGPAEEDVHLQQLGLVGDPLGRLAAGHGAGEVHLRRPVDARACSPRRRAPRARSGASTCGTPFSSRAAVNSYRAALAGIGSMSEVYPTKRESRTQAQCRRTQQANQARRHAE